MEGLKAKKSFGQHFLKHDSIAAQIADSLQHASKTRKVLEVGPGMGMLTRQLLTHSGEYDLWAVEADPDMVDYLKRNFLTLRTRLIQQDFLEFDPETIFGKDPFCVIGNYPYNISTQILFKMIDYRQQVPEMVGMFQKEVADRAAAPPGSKVYGITSVLLQTWFDVEYLFTVEKEAFDPPPKVLSAVIRMTRKEGFEPDCDLKLFKNIIKTAFNQRRKMLRNTLKGFLPTEVLMSDPYFEKRPETLHWTEYVAITQKASAFQTTS